MKNQSIYIIGQVREAGISQLADFEIGKQKLADLGFSNVTTAIDGLPVGDELDKQSAQMTWLGKRKANRLAADTILVLRNYEYDELAIHEARISRQEDHKIVMNINDFINKYANENTAVANSN